MFFPSFSPLYKIHRFLQEFLQSFPFQTFPARITIVHNEFSPAPTGNGFPLFLPASPTQSLLLAQFLPEGQRLPLSPCASQNRPRRRTRRRPGQDCECKGAYSAQPRHSPRAEILYSFMPSLFLSPQTIIAQAAVSSIDALGLPRASPIRLCLSFTTIKWQGRLSLAEGACIPAHKTAFCSSSLTAPVLFHFRIKYFHFFSHNKLLCNAQLPAQEANIMLRLTVTLYHMIL